MADTPALLKLNIPLLPFPQGMGKASAAPAETKDRGSISFIPRDSNGNAIFAGAAPYDARAVSMQNAHTATALGYLCTQWRSMKMAEAPLMVVEETTIGEEWIQDHVLNELLARPNMDYGMRRLIRKTQIYLDTTGRALWVKTRDRAGRVARIYAFAGDEFKTESTSDAIYGKFIVSQRGGQKDYKPSEVVLFHNDRADGDPHQGLAPLEPALSLLNISQELKHRIKYMLRNAAMPGGLYVLPSDANLEEDEFNRVRAEIQNGFTSVASGKTLILEGGGEWKPTAVTIKELMLGGLWREVETDFCACFGLPAAIVNVIAGLENSPWSHISTMERSVDNNTIAPIRGDYEEALTDQLLREADLDPSHLIRFDTSRIRALQTDDVAKGQVTANHAGDWTLNERRAYAGKPRIDDERADVVPDLENPPKGPESTPPSLPNDGIRSSDDNLKALTLEVRRLAALIGERE